MSPEIIIILIASFIIFCLILSNRSNKKEIEDLRLSSQKKEEAFTKDKEALNDDIHRLQDEALSAKKENDTMYQKYFKLVKAYMLARKKSEIEVIAEIEQAITEDYEEFGSKNISVTDYIASAMADYYTMNIKRTEVSLASWGQVSRSEKIADVRKEANILIERAKKNQYAYESLLQKIMTDYPDITEDILREQYGYCLDDMSVCVKYSKEETKSYLHQLTELQTRCSELEKMVNEYALFKDKRWALLKDSIEEYKKEYESNLTAIPYMSRIIADIMTIDIDRLAWSLSWGNNQERKKKVASLNALRKEKQEEIERIKGAEYQLAYLLELYPALQDVIDSEFKEVKINYEEIKDYDPVWNYVGTDEWHNLSPIQRNQLALDRYIASRKKSKWQIGRDFELYCGYRFEQEGFVVDYYGSYHGLEDLGRDLILKKNNKTCIVQCKYWSKTKEIHEKHVMQLYGTLVEYNIENKDDAKGILITNTTLSNKAKEFAKILGIEFYENQDLEDFPRIKCNIGVGEYGEKTKIYHLPFDQQYDSTKISGSEEFMAMTVVQAETAGFRRAYRWHGLD